MPQTKAPPPRLEGAALSRMSGPGAAARRRPTLPHLEMQYHGRWGVSRPSSGWDRVWRPRDGHRATGPDPPAFPGLVVQFESVTASRLGAACGVPFGTSRRRLDLSSIGRLGPLGCVGCPTSTCGLSTCWSGTALQGRPRLEGGFPLRCLQRLSRPRLATQRCHGRDNWYTRGASVPVLSYWGRRLASLLHPRQIGTELSHDVLNPAHVPL